MLREKIDSDLKQAQKNKDTVKISTLRLLKSAVHNDEIARREELKDEDIVVVIKQQVKQRKDSIGGFKKGNRQDLVDKETEELKILQGYLPEELKPEELLNIVKETIAETNAASAKDMGKVMKAVLAKVKGRADGKTVSGLVKGELAKNEKPAEGGGPQPAEDKDLQDK